MAPDWSPHGFTALRRLDVSLEALTSLEWAAYDQLMSLFWDAPLLEEVRIQGHGSGLSLTDLCSVMISRMVIDEPLDVVRFPMLDQKAVYRSNLVVPFLKEWCNHPRGHRRELCVPWWALMYVPSTITLTLSAQYLALGSVDLPPGSGNQEHLDALQTLLKDPRIQLVALETTPLHTAVPQIRDRRRRMVGDRHCHLILRRVPTDMTRETWLPLVQGCRQITAHLRTTRSTPVALQVSTLLSGLLSACREEVRVAVSAETTGSGWELLGEAISMVPDISRRRLRVLLLQSVVGTSDHTHPQLTCTADRIVLSDFFGASGQVGGQLAVRKHAGVGPSWSASVWRA